MIFSNGARMEKSNGRYSFFSNLKYHYVNLRRQEPLVFWMGFLALIPWTAASILGNVLPSVVVVGLESSWGIQRYFFTLIVLILALWVCTMLQNMAQAFMENSRTIYRAHYSKPYVEKKMKVDYDVLEEKNFQTQANASYTAIYQGRGIDDATLRLSTFLNYLIPAAVYAVLLARVSIWIIVLAIPCAVIQIWFLKLARQKHSEQHPHLSNYSKKLNYLTNQTMETASGKDIRIFRMQDWLTKKYMDNLTDMNRLYGKVHNWYFLRNVADAGLDFLRNGLVYTYLIYLTANGRLGISQFVLFFGFANSFAEQMLLAMREALSFGIISNTFSSIRDYFDTKEHRNEGKRAAEEEVDEIKRAPVTLELRDVSFTYDEKAKPVISHMNLTIAAGEKLALIGLNGAGKTTLVKLICGFYKPTGGEILLNGRNIEDFDREQYYSLISVLFQDFTLLPLTVDENIASVPGDKVKQARLRETLALSGFLERYGKLPKKGGSMLIREINEDAVDFSGGEKQRLLFARALYKEAPLLILDEPTAALDPIAENEIYLKYSEASRGKTSIYISHRLSSTRFCDRIILLENGRITESGTHDELIEKNGRYAELFELQSKYYKEQEAEKIRQKAMEA